MSKPKTRPRRPRAPVPGWARGLKARDTNTFQNVVSTLTPTEHLLAPDTSRPTANFNDPLLRQHAYRVRDIGLCAFLVALAAWQRGLKVSFHYEVASKSPRFANAAVQGYRGEMLSVSDGRATHFFRRTLGDLTTQDVSQCCDNKQATKEQLLAHGIKVPEGVVVERSDRQKVAAFLTRHPDRHFILKPLEGTRGEGVYRNLPPQRVMPTLAEASPCPHLLETYVPGPQYRVMVVGGRYVASWENRLPQVVGDGRQDIATLMAQARQRSHECTHPLLVTDDLTLKPDVIHYLAEQGLTPESVPSEGSTVVVWPEPDDKYGAEAVDATDTLPHHARLVAVKAAQALNLPVAGMDVIVERGTEQSIVLEANQMPMIRAMTFPYNGQGQGNRFAEAMIDHYFPGSIDNPRHVKASFDFVQVCQALQSGTVGEVTLPVLGSNWVHRRVRISAAQVGERTEHAIRNAMFTYGIHAQLIKSKVGDLMVDVVAPEARYHLFMSVLQGRFKPQ